MTTERSLLFVPGDRPERFDKALAAGADLVVIDLEDAVLPAAKNNARDHIANWLSAPGPVQIAIRINGTDTDWSSEDLALAASSPRVAAIMLPKAEKRTVVEAVAARLRRGQRLIALVETASGYVERLDIARARGVSRIAFGSVDFCAETGIGTMGDGLNAIRMELVVASTAAGLPPPIEGVTLQVKDSAALAQDVARARRLGFGGKLCIHPSQVEAVNTGFAPSPDELDWARRVPCRRQPPGRGRGRWQARRQAGARPCQAASRRGELTPKQTGPPEPRPAQMPGVPASSPTGRERSSFQTPLAMATILSSTSNVPRRNMMLRVRRISCGSSITTSPIWTELTK